MTDGPSSQLLAAIERSRRRIWALCYRMTGSRSDADDLSQESLARAIEREHDLTDRRELEGWLFRIATNACLDHLRRVQRIRRVTDLVDPLDLPELGAGAERAPDAEASTILRDDLRFAVMVALQHLSAKQRAALVLHDVCERSLAEVAATLETNPNAVKALLGRARKTLARARVHTNLDRTVDPAAVERVARAIETRSLDALTELLTEDAWGIVDGGGVVPVATRPSFGRRAVSRRWANALRRLLTGVEITCEVRPLNGEPAVVLRVPGVGPFATVHVETRHGLVAALRVVRDPRKLGALADTVH